MAFPCPDPVFSPHCFVLVLQHYYKCGTSLLVFPSADSTRFSVWECPMPWHSLCFPQAYDLCVEALPRDTQMDPFGFVRNIGSWPGKVLFCAAPQLEPSDAIRGPPPPERSFTDIWSWCPLDPLPLVPRASRSLDPSDSGLVRGDPLWTCQRFWDTADPTRFWESTEQQYLCMEKALSIRRKLDALMVLASGQVPIGSLFHPPIPDNDIDYADMHHHEVM